jgi:hypothetical protein
MIYFSSLDWVVLSFFMLLLVRVFLVPIFYFQEKLFTIDFYKKFNPSASEQPIAESWKASKD